MESLSLSIWSRNLSEFAAYRPGDSVVALGYWHAMIDENPNRNPKKAARMYLNRELHLWPVLKSQICAMGALRPARSA